MCVERFLRNEVARLNKRFTGNITDIVKKIMKTEQKVLRQLKILKLINN